MESRNNIETDIITTYINSKRLTTLAVRLLKFKRDQWIIYNYNPAIGSLKRYTYPNPDCTESRKDKSIYKEIYDLNNHLRKIYRSLGFIVIGRYYYLYGSSFKKTRDLILHKKSDYRKIYASKAEPYYPFFK